MLAVIFQSAFYLVHYLPLQEIFKALAVFVQQPFLLLFCTVKKKELLQNLTQFLLQIVLFCFLHVCIFSINLSF